MNRYILPRNLFNQEKTGFKNEAIKNNTRQLNFRFVDGECGSSSGDSTGQLELSGGEQPEEASPASMHETNNNSLLHEDLERRIP